jgi:hypothetical protein
MASTNGATYSGLLIANMLAGNNDYGLAPPAGYSAGTTNLMVLNPNASGSNLLGILNPGVNGWSMILFNQSLLADITILDQSASSAYNWFSCPLEVSWVIQPQSALLIVYINGIGWTIT